jgi:hypothetical protein
MLQNGKNYKYIENGTQHHLHWLFTQGYKNYARCQIFLPKAKIIILFIY